MWRRRRPRDRAHARGDRDAAADGDRDARRRPVAAKPGLRLKRIGSFSSPVYVTAPPGDRRRIFVVEQGGRVRIVRDGKTLSQPFLDVSGRISSGGERGLLSLAFAPDYRKSGLFYVYYTAKNGDIRIVEYQRASADRADARLGARSCCRCRTRRPTTTAAWCCSAPTACSTPASATAAGAATSTARAATAQNLGTLLGKILRIDPRRDGRRPYTRAASATRSWAAAARGRRSTPTALRNPWRFAFDAATATSSIADVGQGEVEEVDIVRAQGREPRLARVRGPQPLRAGRDGARARPAGHPALPLRRQLLDHRRRRGARPGAARRCAAATCSATSAAA